MPNRPSTTRPGVALGQGVDESAPGWLGAAPARAAVSAETGALAGQVDDGDVDAGVGVGQVGGRFERVAAVVAGTGQQQHAALRLAGDQRQRDVGRGLAGALHQGAGRQRGGGGVFDRADLGDGV